MGCSGTSGNPLAPSLGESENVENVIDNKRNKWHERVRIYNLMFLIFVYYIIKLMTKK